MEPTLEEAIETARNVSGALNSVIQGRSDTVALVVTALIADGHVLVEDLPGSGKTTLAKTLGRLISCVGDDELPRDDLLVPFRRIQFTPDLLPGDLLGVNIFEPNRGVFRFMPGPVFSHILLADEINRTGPKVQSAFLECMAEKQVTIDNETRRLDDLFFVIATQNPLDMAGTYPLPIVQLDRFLFKVPMGYVSREEEITILRDHHRIANDVGTIRHVTTRSAILRARLARQRVTIADSLRDGIIDIVRATRESPLVQYGASTRAALMLQEAIRGWAIVSGRTYATEDDLKAVLAPVLLHRVKLHGGAGRESLEAFLEVVRTPLERLVGRIS